MVDPNKPYIPSSHEIDFSAGWRTEAREDVFDADTQLRRRYPGIDPDAMRQGPTSGHWSLMEGKIERGELGGDATSTGQSTIAPPNEASSI